MKIKLLKFLLIMLFYSYANADDCAGDTTSQWNHCSGTINSWYGTYIGGFKNGMKHGKGIIHYYNGDKFVGIFKDGKKNGKGAFTYSSGETSSGKWQNDLFIGK